ncbi:glycosyl hydrolase family 3 N terminal domain-containing protein [Fusarium solani]|uniref:beta-glucosidase n=1 Tax=Fusarium solani TaxID=169388 RepID=A0A9P9L2S5_FUSSL|nr:glycosyl hydrolase family 3 N terminal domain-containing protein [Fusarium solani]KAH7272936.1 glycosyl hydrolase family 3 N terminal domain-containing protein [Fusarium solani]
MTTTAISPSCPWNESTVTTSVSGESCVLGLLPLPVDQLDVGLVRPEFQVASTFAKATKAASRPPQSPSLSPSEPATGPLGRTPTGGRNWEAFSVDPYVVGVAMAETISGILDGGSIACAKHYIGNEEEHHLPSIRRNKRLEK